MSANLGAHQTTSGFWIGVFVLGMLYLKNEMQWLLIIVVLSLSGLVISNEDILAARWKGSLENLKNGEIFVSNDLWQQLSNEQLTAFFLLPSNFSPNFINRVLLEQQKNYLGPYSKRLVAQNQLVSIESPINLSDINWENGVAKNWAGFILVNIPQNSDVATLFRTEKL